MKKERKKKNCCLGHACVESQTGRLNSMKRERCSQPPAPPWGPQWRWVSPPHPHLYWAAAGLPTAHQGSSLHLDTRPCGSFEWLCRGARGSSTVFMTCARLLSSSLSQMVLHFSGHCVYSWIEAELRGWGVYALQVFTGPANWPLTPV